MNSDELISRYCSSMPTKRRERFIKHSKNVLRKSLNIAREHTEFRININKLTDMALLHDIGVCQLTKETPYIKHGIIGKKILEKEGYKNIAKVCERHIGSGITKKEARLLGLPPKDMLPRTIEEKIVCYADKFYSKSKDKVHTVTEIKNEFTKYGEDELKRFEKLHKLFL